MERTIAVLQKILARLGYLTVTPDPNVLDDPTRAALRRFQQLHELPATGEPDDRSWERLHAADDRGECIVLGQVVDQVGPVERAVVSVRDRDLGEPASWPVLGMQPTGPDGRFVITYLMEQVLPDDRRIDGRSAVPDLVFDLRELPVRADGFELYRLPGATRVDDDERSLGIEARRLEEVRIVIRTIGRRWSDGASEYERVLAAFRAVWPQISPADLDDGRREPVFVARELDVPKEQVDALVSAFRLTRGPFNGSVPEPILYGLARSQQHVIGLPRLALATSGQLKEGIAQAIAWIIIPPQSAETVDRAIRQIQQLAPPRALSDDVVHGGVGYGAVLRNATPDDGAQAAFVRVAAEHQGDPAALWQALRAHPAFAAPGMIERTQFALQLDALTNRHLPLMDVLQRDRGITSTRALLDLGADDLKAIVSRPDVGVPDGTPGADPAERVANYVTGLTTHLQFAFPTETVTRALASAPAEAVGGEATRRAVTSALTVATSEALRAAGNSFDIRTTHIDSYLQAHGGTVLADVAEDQRAAVVAELKRAQRLYRVSTGVDSFAWLLAKGYGSAFDIAQVPQQTFVISAQGALGEAQALMMHGRAVQTSSATLATYVHLSDAVFGIYPKATLDGDDAVTTVDGIKKDIVKYLPTWSELFGQVSWCACVDCRSVYGPAAYLVDLLHFLDKSATNAHSPLDVLLSRRPDLAQLPLTCENTNTVIPYVDLVNEVLESLVVSLDPTKIPAFDTEGATTKELQATPQHTNSDAYVTPGAPGTRARLDRAVYPSNLPFDAPLLAARTYLRHLEVSRADLMAAFSDAGMTNALAAERLGLSPNTFAVITGVTLDGAPADLPASIDERFGFTVTAAPAGVTALTALPHVPTLIERARLTFEELTALLTMRYLNPERRTFDVVRRLPGADLLAFVQAGVENPSAALVAALTADGIAQADFTTWAQTHLAGDAWTRLRQTIVIDGPTDQPCNLEASTVRHWDVAAPQLNDADWLRIDRVVRLWRALGWELEEVDLALTALGATEITAAVVRQLAQTHELARALDLSIAQAVGLWSPLDPTRAGSLYEQRFHSRALLRLDPAFEPDWAGRILAGATIGAHLPALQAGLRCSGTDLAALRPRLGLADDGVALDLGRLSVLFQHVTLAKALKVNVRDLIRLLDITGLDPFQAPSDDLPMLAFVNAARRVQGSGINPAQLQDVLADTATPVASDARDRLLAALRDGLRSIASDLDPASETDGSLTRRALTLLRIDPGLVDTALQVVLGTDRTTVVLTQAPHPAPAIPNEWAERLHYQPQPPSLSCLGALTDAERLTVRNFSADFAYHNAVDALHAAPRALLQRMATELGKQQIGFPDAATLLTNSVLVDDAVQREATIAARLKVILDTVLPPLRDRLGRTLVKQTITGLPLEASVAALLLEGERAPGKPLFPAQDPTQPLMVDFLALATSDDTTKAAEAYELLARLRILVDALALGADDVTALAKHLVTFRATTHRLCTAADWETIAGYARVRARPGQPDGRLAELWAATTDAATQSVLSDVLGWPAETIAGLLGPAGLGLGVAGVQRLADLERLITAGTVVQTLGVPVAQAVEWARQPIAQAAADATRGAAKAKYDETAWLDVARTLSDPVRDARRAALVSYVAPRLGVRDANVLYETLLLDVEMSACMQTSRIKQAISSVQLFIQRCLLNLEAPRVSPQAIDGQRWKWMQNYRVWEANRKVLLYPENWVLPELRDDKTPFFKDLEASLLQDDVTDLNVERALVDYLEKLDKVAKLEIIALHVQNDFETGEKLQTVVHVFGRTANPACAYFYRRYVVTDNGTALWTPWEAVPVDVQGTLIAPVIFNRRLYLFWAVVTTKTHEPSTGGKVPSPPDPYQEIQLAWSEYRDGAWSPKHVTDTNDVLTADFPDYPPTLTAQGTQRGPDVIERLAARVEGNRLRVLCIATRDIVWSDDEKKLSRASQVVLDDQGNVVIADGNMAYTDALGSFLLDGCHGRMTKSDPDDQWTENGVVFRLRDTALQVKPLGSKPIPARPVMNAYDPSQLTEADWIHEHGGFMAFGDANRTYFGQLSMGWRFPDEIARTPNGIEPILDRPPLHVRPSALEAAQIPMLTELRSTAEAASNPWVSASASLATVIARPTLEVRPANGLGVRRESAVVMAAKVHAVGAQFASDAQTYGIRFETLFHPFVCTYLERLQQYGVPGVLTVDNQQLTLSPSFTERYQPKAMVATPFPVDSVDFGATDKPGIYRTTSYSAYNWELFFHIPMFVADRLSQNQRFEDAMRWFHYVFNPIDGHGGYWKFLPFLQTPRQTLADWLKQLNAGDPDLQRQVAEWQDHPFEPHRVARMRLTSYEKYVVMRYLDNLIAWGDQLFERDTIESINQATQLYVLAAELLGPSPERIPPRGEPDPMTFAQMRGKLDALSNVAAEFENAFPSLSSATMAGAQDTAGLLGISRSLYFCLPQNDKLLAYWDTVADRLFKIRNCMNIAGVVRQLPLFEPPIDPALLVRAAAQGIDLGSVLSDVSAPLPYYRFDYMLRKALDVCADLKALGAELLAVLEKKDAESLAAMRATHETVLFKATLEIRKQQEQEADEQIAALGRSRAVPVERLRYYRGLMAMDQQEPESGAKIPLVAYPGKPASSDGVFLITEEEQELNASHSARDWEVRSTTMKVLASLMHYIPDLEIEMSPWGVGITTLVIGGTHIGPALTAISDYQKGLAAEDTYDATHAGKMAMYRRRAQDYAFQANLAALETMAIDKQITAATIRKAIATLERQHVERQITQAEHIEEYLQSKYTNAELYGWMQGQIGSLYFQSYKLAYDLATQTERCFRFERGITSSNYVQFGAWDSLRKGLLAGDRLHLQLKQLERAYQDQHRREFELTKHVSLLHHAPLALIALKETGRCEFDLPELLYDMDHPGHYMRRLKMVSVTIPAVVGPYTSVNATLTLLTSETRISSALKGDKYERDLESDDPRFVDDFAAIQSIATSSGQNDSGMFELSFRDDRYLHFEGAGAASRWRIDLDPDCNGFPLEDLTDVVLQLKYTARPGGERLRAKAKERLKKLVADQDNVPLARLFSLKHEFPSEWYRFRTVAEANGDHVQTIGISRDRFPILFRRSAITIGKLDVFGVPKPDASATKLPGIVTPKPEEAVVALAAGSPLKPLLHQTGTAQVVVKDTPTQAGWRLTVAKADVAASIDQLDDLLIVCHYAAKAPSA
jgi:hypothetical protein